MEESKFANQMERTPLDKPATMAAEGRLERRAWQGRPMISQGGSQTAVQTHGSPYPHTNKKWGGLLKKKGMR